MHKAFRLFSTLKSITVYEAPYYNALAKIKGDFVSEASSVLKEKYHEFVPFYIESCITLIRKRFILKIELLPEDSKLRVTSLQIGSLDVADVPIENIVPVPPVEFETAHMGGKMLDTPDYFDLDMVFLNRPNSEFYIFDKEGVWHEEGVNHPMLSLEKTFDEHKWFDFICLKNSSKTGGTVFPFAY